MEDSTPSTSKSPKKSPRKSPISSFLSRRSKLVRGQTAPGPRLRPNDPDDIDEDDLSKPRSSGRLSPPGKLGCLSTPSSPSLGRVSKIISKSDANLIHSLKGKRHRHDSGDSVASSGRMTPDDGKRSRSRSASTRSHPANATPSTSAAAVASNRSNTPESMEGSPSRALTFMAKATGYVNHLKSRLGKHRERIREDGCSQDPTHMGDHTHSRDGQFASCCHRNNQNSSDTLAANTNANSSTGAKGLSSSNYVPGTSTPPTNTGATTGAASSSGGGSVLETTSSISVNVSSSFNSSTTSSQDSLTYCSQAHQNTNEEGTTNMGQYPFHTMTVHLQRGKNLVARDTCGSSDPYVKVKVGDKLHYKSKTINRDLNPVWDESFVLPISDLNQQVIFKVFDYDWGFQDDFMGMTSLDPSRLPANKQTDLSLILTETNTPGTEYMGEIFLSVTLVPRTIEEKEIWISGDGSGRLVDASKRLKSQIWSSVLTILLLDAKNMSPGEDAIIMDCYVKFRLGNQKYKTRTIQRSSAPKWVEQFDFYLYEGQPQILEIQVFDESFSREYIGRVAIDIGLLEKEFTHHKTLKLQEGNGDISMLLTVSGTSGAESISDLGNYNPNSESVVELKSKFALSRSFNSLSDVGCLTVKVFEAQGLAALDIGGKSDPFCVLELVNARLQTQTEYRTLNPVWNKIFTFEIKDVTSVLELTVYDEDKNHKQEFLGKLNIPLWKIKNGEKKWYMLKDQKLLRTAPGNNPKIMLELDLAWNPIRAGIRILDPAESKFLLPDQRLRRETFLLNIDRLKKIGMAIYEVIQYVESCMAWEFPLRSIIALVTYQIVCYTFQPYMIPLFIMLLMLRQWITSSITGKPLVEDEFALDDSMLEDDDDEKEEDDKKMTLRQKLQAVQDATQTVQNVLGDIASFCESTRNTFRMAVPFVSWIVVVGLFLGTIVLYYIPVRYLAMAYGFHKFFKPILRPNAVPTNEVLNIIQRVPDNMQLIYFRPLRPAASPKASTSGERNRSPQGRSAEGTAPKGGKEPKKKYKFW